MPKSNLTFFKQLVNIFIYTYILCLLIHFFYTKKLNYFVIT